MKSERVVQITDPHIVENYEDSVLYWDPIDALRSVVSSISSLSKKPQYVIATGDLVHNPSAANYLALKNILSTLDMPVFVIPGNHDSVPKMQEFLVGNNIELVDYKVLAEIDWALVFVDSQVPGKEYGDISLETIAKLQTLYRSLGNRNVLLALHHSLTPECLTPSCQLMGTDRLLNFLDENDSTKAVVSGHMHCVIEREHAGVKLLTTPSTLFHVDHFQNSAPKENDRFMDYHKFDGEKKGFRVLDLFEDGSISTEVCWV